MTRMPTDHAEAPTMRSARYVGYRPCPARTGYFELIVQLDGTRLTWCLPGPVDAEASTDVAGDVALVWQRRSVYLAEEYPDGSPPTPISLSRALALLGNARTRLAIDERLVALHA
jgi:hypothetical protein